MRGVILGILAVLAALGLGYAIIQLAQQGSIESNLGANELIVGEHLNLSQKIMEEGPIPYQSQASGTPSIYLQHLGEDPRRGWLAFDTSWPDSDCILNWNAQVSLFEPTETEACAGFGRVEANGEGLRQHLVRINSEGRVVVRFVSEQTDSSAGE